MKWTTAKPTKPGWYWFRFAPGNYTIVERYDMPSHGLGLWSNNKVLPLLNGEFSDPLEPPIEESL